MSGQTTCWTLIHAAAAGGRREREEFAERYAPVVRQYLAARWKNRPLADSIDDAAQEVFVDCFREGGVLERADRRQQAGFRAFLYGVVRIVAMRCEERDAKFRGRNASDAVDIRHLAADETALSRVFDRAWAEAILREAGQRHLENARHAGADALRRIELLRLRFHDELPIREIATRWQVEPNHVHREYAKARKEYDQALREVITYYHPGYSAKQIEEECADLLARIK